MPADGGVDVRIGPRQLHRAAGGLQITARVEDPSHAVFGHGGEQRLTVGIERLVVVMRVGVKNQAHRVSFLFDRGDDPQQKGISQTAYSLAAEIKLPIGSSGVEGKAPKRRRWRKKRGGFEEAARLARPKRRGNRCAATVEKPLALSWGFKGVILYGREWPLWSCRRQAANVAPLSSGKCGAAVRRQMSCRPQAADLTRSPVSGCRRPRRPSSAASGSARRRCSWP